MNKKDCILMEGISKEYGKCKVLNKISLTIKQGEIYGLLGPSGCGKSTCVKIIAGILKPDEGIVKILGTPMPNFNVMQNIGYMAQAAAVYPTLSGLENLNFFGRLFGLKKEELKNRIYEVAKLVHLDNELKKEVRHYSGGMKQRLSLAITLLPNPKVLILDEPTVGIDPLLRQSIWKELRSLRDQGVTIVITTHVMDEVEKCDQLSMMRNGKLLASGTPEEVQKMARASSIEEAFIYFSKEEAGEDD